MNRLDLQRIEPVSFPETQYIRDLHPKRQAVLHHTVSPVGVEGDISWWLQTSARIATCLIIHHDGTPYQCFGSKYWAHHLGVKSSFLKSRGFGDYKSKNVYLNQSSCAIEIDGLGGLTEYNGNWYMTHRNEDGENEPNLRMVVKRENVEFYPNGFRGFEAFEKYTDAQIQTVGETLLLWHDRYGIPLDYKGDVMWDVTDRALSGEPGVWTHVSYRPDKSDCHPQPSLIDMLQRLNRYK